MLRALRSTLPIAGYSTVAFRSFFGDVSLWMRRFANCQCHDIRRGTEEFSAMSLLPDATLVFDCFHVAVRSHTVQAARCLSALQVSAGAFCCRTPVRWKIALPR
jgi:hypothetical protein